MKHINKKIRLAGAVWVTPDGRRFRHRHMAERHARENAPRAPAPSEPKKNKKQHGKGPEIIPPVYLPPQLGEHQYGASHSYAETIDLITDGPIEGLVNQNGLVCDGPNILQGIYLDDTPIAVTNNADIEGYKDVGSQTDPIGTLATADTDLVSTFFQTIKGINKLTSHLNPTVEQNLFSTSVRRYNSSTVRREIVFRRGIGSFKLFRHTTGKPAGFAPIETAGTSNFTASGNSWQVCCVYADNSTIQDAKFMLGLGNMSRYATMWSDRRHLNYSAQALWANRSGSLNCCGLNNSIKSIRTDFFEQDDNPHQKELARRTLKKIDTQFPDGAEEPEVRLKTILDASSLRNCHVVLRPDPAQTGLSGLNMLNGGQLMDYSFKYLDADGNNAFEGKEGIYFYDFLTPEIDENGVLTGNVKGFLLVSFQWEEKASGARQAQNLENPWWGRAYGIPNDINDALSSIASATYSRNIKLEGGIRPQNIKFNYSNVLAEFRKGTEDQLPLKYFNKVFIDHPFKTSLYGPFRTNGKSAQKVRTTVKMLTRDWESFPAVDPNTQLPIEEGSEDRRAAARSTVYDYANWAQDSLPAFEEEAIPVTHVVLNPNVESIFVTLMVGQLHDTLHTQKRGIQKAKEGSLEPGATFPSILNVAITTGLIDANGAKTPHKTRNYRICALIESSTLIDIGNPDGNAAAFNFVEPLGDSETIVTPIPLPAINQDTLRAHEDANLNKSVVITADSHISVQRYVEVKRLSTETNSVLISKSLDLDKITEIIPVNLTYPFSTMVGTKLDSRSFGNIPVRSFDCKLKKVRVPSNYKPLLGNGVDKRYYLTQGEFDERAKVYKKVYHGDWNGEFDEDLQWTDNPAWILYDLLTNTRYGLGQHIKEKDVNKWQLYEIGRFCDAVDDDGYFLGVADGHGGREPRFSCNIVFDANIKIYDALNALVGLFRGALFFNNGEINFTDDRPRETVDLFTNDSVKDGLFHYANNRRDQSYNTIEVSYLDRFDSYIPKVEIVENEEDIRQRGVFKKKMSAAGITSRGMARRAAEQQIFSSLKENQTVAFEAGLETLLCQPGDLVIVEDELKTLKENFGKILEVNVAEGDQQGTIRLSNKFVDADMTGKLTVYTPTGRDTISGIQDVANKNRQRSIGFNISGGMTALSVSGLSKTFSGDYNFSGYTAGYPYASGDQATGLQFEEYALYTGTGLNRGAVDSNGESIENLNILYFATGFSGWVFATGGSGAQTFVDSNTHTKFIAGHTGQTLYDLGTGFVNWYDVAVADRRGASTHANVSGLFSGNNILDSITQGFIPSEVMLAAPSQTTVLNVTGEITLKDYGCLVSGFDQPEFLPLLKLGSACKFEIKEASPFIYKVMGIKEVDPNQFLVTANKYETGKWELIENSISIEEKANTYSYTVAQTLGDVTYTTLDPPKWTGITTGHGTNDDTFFVSGDFTDPNGGPPIADSNATGFHVVLTSPIDVVEQTVTAANDNSSPKDGFCVKFDNLTTIGHYAANVCALGNQGSTNESEAYFNSSYDQTGMFVLFEEELQLGRSIAAGEILIG